MLSFRLLKSSLTQRWKPPRVPRTDWFRFPVGCLKNPQGELKPSSAPGVIWDAPVGGTQPAPELPLHKFDQQLMCFAGILLPAWQPCLKAEQCSFAGDFWTLCNPFPRSIPDMRLRMQDTFGAFPGFSVRIQQASRRKGFPCFWALFFLQ